MLGTIRYVEYRAAVLETTPLPTIVQLDAHAPAGLVPEHLADARIIRFDDGEALLVAGTSLAVMSGLRFIRHSANEGKPVIIINRGQTRGDDYAKVRLNAGTTETLRAIEAGIIRG